MKIAYFVHDLHDPTVARRLKMFRAADASVALFGFSRARRRTETVEGLAPTDLGVTHDARLLSRIGAVIVACLRAPAWRRRLGDADVIVARQLETLLVAFVARMFAGASPPIAFECVDIHRTMLRDDAIGGALRAIEGWLLRRSALLVVSSPGFVEHYFAVRHRRLPPVHLLENKLLFCEAAEIDASRCAAGRVAGPASAPWTIGWYGVIRCARSLTALADLARRYPGAVEVIIAGRVAENLRARFEAVVSGTPGLTFLGPYDRARDLGRLYDGAHFTWAIDFYEQGGNSDWLLPNRLYEGGYCRSVPIALAGSETGAWLSRRGVGLLIDDPIETSLPARLGAVDQPGYLRERDRMRALPDALFVLSRRDCLDLGDRLAALNPAGG